MPLIISLLLCFAARRVPTRWLRVLLGDFGICLLLSSLYYAIQVAPYLWALHLEQRWIAAQPTTRAEFESCLSLYSEHDIQPYQSVSGSHEQLRPGDHMIEYLLLWKAPSDVVYDSNDVITQIYTSYE